MAMYLTVQEFKNSPTAIDCSNIIPGASQTKNDAELTNVIRRASSWINQICKMPTLEATSNTETKEVYMNGSGLIRIHPDMTPIITLVDSVQYKMSPINGWVPLTITDISVFQRYFTIYNLSQAMISPEGVQPFSIIPYRTPYAKWDLKNIPVIVQYTYVNGYPNTILNVGATAGTSSITVQNATGMVGQTLTIYDSDFTEDVTILSVVGNIVNLTAPTMFAHLKGTAVSALPDSVKQATILLTAYLIKERGSMSISMGEQTMQGIKQTTGTDVNIAKEMLRPFIRGVIS